MTEQLDPGLDVGEAPVWRLSPATAVRRRGEDRVRRRRGVATGLAGLATAVTVLGSAALTGPAGSGPVAIATARSMLKRTTSSCSSSYSTPDVF